MAFKITAQVRLSGPPSSQIQSVTNQIRNSLNTVSVPVNVRVNPSAYRNLANLNTQLNGVNSSINDINKSSSGLKTSISSAASAAKSTSKQMSQLASTTSEAASAAELYGRSVRNAFGRYFTFTALTSAFVKIGSSIRGSFSEALQFETELVKIAQVAETTKANLKPLSDEVSRLSKTYGISSVEILKSARTLKQTGLSVAEVQKAIEALTKTQLSATFGDLNSTTEASIAIMNQFKDAASGTGVNVNNLEEILSTINRVTANFAIESQDVTAAVRRVGSAFVAASPPGQDAVQTFREFAATLTSVRQTTRATAESIATGIRTISARLQRGSTIRFLEGFDIQLRDREGQFIGVYNAIGELNKALANTPTTSAKFSAIVEALGGIRQIDKTIPLIKQYSVAQEVLKKSLEDTNNISGDADKALGTLANQFARVRESFNEMVRGFTEDEGLRQLVSIFLTGAKAAIEMANAVRNLGTSIDGLGTLVGLVGVGRFLTSGLRGQGNSFSGFLKGLFGGKSPVGRNSGGPIPGSGNSDTVPAMLTPGEFVIRKSAARAIGSYNLNKLNHADKNKVSFFADGGNVGRKNVSYAGVEFPISNNPYSGENIVSLIRRVEALEREKSLLLSSSQNFPKGLSKYDIDNSYQETEAALKINARELSDVSHVIETESAARKQLTQAIMNDVRQKSSLSKTDRIISKIRQQNERKKLTISYAEQEERTRQALERQDNKYRPNRAAGLSTPEIISKVRGYVPSDERLSSQDTIKQIRQRNEQLKIDRKLSQIKQKELDIASKNKGNLNTQDIISLSRLNVRTKDIVGSDISRQDSVRQAYIRYAESPQGVANIGNVSQSRRASRVRPTGKSLPVREDNLLPSVFTGDRYTALDNLKRKLEYIDSGKITAIGGAAAFIGQMAAQSELLGESGSKTVGQISNVIAAMTALNFLMSQFKAYDVFLQKAGTAIASRLNARSLAGIGVGAAVAAGGLYQRNQGLSNIAEGRYSQGTSQTVSGGVLAGAGTGAAIGSLILPGFGTAVGAATGALIGFITGVNEAKQAVKDSSFKKQFDIVQKRLTDIGDGEFKQSDIGQVKNLFDELDVTKRAVIGSTPSYGSTTGYAQPVYGYVSKSKEEIAQSIEKAGGSPELFEKLFKQTSKSVDLADFFLDTPENLAELSAVLGESRESIKKQIIANKEAAAITKEVRVNYEQTNRKLLENARFMDQFSATLRTLEGDFSRFDAVIAAAGGSVERLNFDDVFANTEKGILKGSGFSLDNLIKSLPPDARFIGEQAKAQSLAAISARQSLQDVSVNPEPFEKDLTAITEAFQQNLQKLGVPAEQAIQQANLFSGELDKAGAGGTAEAQAEFVKKLANPQTASEVAERVASGMANSTGNAISVLKEYQKAMDEFNVGLAGYAKKLSSTIVKQITDFSGIEKDYAKNIQKVQAYGGASQGFLTSSGLQGAEQQRKKYIGQLGFGGSGLPLVQGLARDRKAAYQGLADIQAKRASGEAVFSPQLVSRQNAFIAEIERTEAGLKAFTGELSTATEIEARLNYLQSQRKDLQDVALDFSSAGPQQQLQILSDLKSVIGVATGQNTGKIGSSARTLVEKLLPNGREKLLEQSGFGALNKLSPEEQKLNDQLRNEFTLREASSKALADNTVQINALTQAYQNLFQKVSDFSLQNVINNKVVDNAQNGPKREVAVDFQVGGSVAINVTGLENLAEASTKAKEEVAKILPIAINKWWEQQSKSQNPIQMGPEHLTTV